MFCFLLKGIKKVAITKIKYIENEKYSVACILLEMWLYRSVIENYLSYILRKKNVPKQSWRFRKLKVFIPKTMLGRI